MNSNVSKHGNARVDQQQAPGFTRRSLFKMGAVAGALALGSGAISGCTPYTTSSETASSDEYGTSPDGAATLKFLKRPKPITDFVDEKEYDVVVVGAGASGVPCALSAFENGAKVAVVQKGAEASAAGNFAGGPLLDSSDPAGVEALISAHIVANNNVARRDIVGLWIKNAGEALTWLIDRCTEAGAQVVDMGNAAQPACVTINGYNLNYITAYFGPKPYTFSDGMVALANLATEKGVEFFYNTPAVQLITDDTGAVTGVIAEGEEGYIRFNAKKGVVLACGDFQNNEEMSNYYMPSCKYLARKMSGRTGDGHIMGYWAGAVITPPNSKMVHDMDAGPTSMMDLPCFLNVNQKGERFAPETCGMYVMNNYLSDEVNAGHYAQVFDANYMDYADKFPGMVSPEELRPYMPEEDVERVGVNESFIGTYKADTLEELAQKMEIDPDTFVKSVNRYNELVKLGKDEDFGKPANMLLPIETPPFYGIHRWVRLSAIDGGLLVDGSMQCLNAEQQPIPGLYAIGVVSSGFSGGDDWLTATGLAGSSLGRAVTDGYVVGKNLAAL